MNCEPELAYNNTNSKNRNEHNNKDVKDEVRKSFHGKFCTSLISNVEFPFNPT